MLASVHGQYDDVVAVKAQVWRQGNRLRIARSSERALESAVRAGASAWRLDCSRRRERRRGRQHRTFLRQSRSAGPSDQSIARSSGRIGRRASRCPGTDDGRQSCSCRPNITSSFEKPNTNASPLSTSTMSMASPKASRESSLVRDRRTVRRERPLACHRIYTAGLLGALTSTSSVPEPATMSLLALGLAASLFGRARQRVQ